MADPYGPNKPPQFGEVGIEEALANADKYGKEFGGVPSVSRTLAAEVRRLREERDAAKRDARRFDWWFSFESTKSAGIIEDYLIGMSETWELDKWRACIDKHMNKQAEEIVTTNQGADHE